MDLSSRPAHAKSSQGPSQDPWLDMVVCICYPSYMESINRRIIIQASPGTKRDLSSIVTQKGLKTWLK
jgi:hypothetical protein